MKVAKRHNLCFKWSKCNFDAEEISILEVVVGRGEVWMKNDKIRAVMEWKTSTKIKEVESFLGFKNFRHTVRPLNKLEEKKELKWKEIVNSELK